MDLLVTVERRYVEYNGDYYVKGIEDDLFFSRYKDDFDHIVVLARVNKVTALPGGYKKLVDEQLTVEPLYTKSIGVFKLKGIFKIIRKYSDSKFIIRTPGILSYFFSIYCLILKKSFSLEVVTNPYQEAINATSNIIVNKILAYILPNIFRLQLKKCRFASFVTKKEIQEKYLTKYEIRSEKFNSYYSSINLSSGFYNKKYSLPKENKVVLLFVGVLDRDFKGLDIFISIISKLPCKYKGIVVGDGELLTYYKQLASDLSVLDRIDFRGYVSCEVEKRAIYSSSDFFVLTSRREGLPRVVIEAMANSLPCICTDVSGVRELISHELIFPIDDVIAGCELIMSFDDNAYEFHSNNNYIKSLDFSLDNIIPKRRKYYHKIME